MCIKINNKLNDSELKYNYLIPLEQQIENSDLITIDYDPKDKDIDKFISEMERLVKNGITCNVTLNLLHNNHLRGLKAKRQLKRIKRDLDLNEAIKLLVRLHSELDKGLENISDICRNK